MSKSLTSSLQLDLADAILSLSSSLERQLSFFSIDWSKSLPLSTSSSRSSLSPSFSRSKISKSSSSSTLMFSDWLSSARLSLFSKSLVVMRPAGNLVCLSLFCDLLWNGTGEDEVDELEISDELLFRLWLIWFALWFNMAASRLLANSGCSSWCIDWGSIEKFGGRSDLFSGSPDGSFDCCTAAAAALRLRRSGCRCREAFEFGSFRMVLSVVPRSLGDMFDEALLAAKSVLFVGLLLAFAAWFCGGEFGGKNGGILSRRLLSWWNGCEGWRKPLAAAATKNGFSCEAGGNWSGPGGSWEGVFVGGPAAGVLPAFSAGFEFGMLAGGKRVAELLSAADGAFAGKLNGWGCGIGNCNWPFIGWWRPEMVAGGTLEREVCWRWNCNWCRWRRCWNCCRCGCCTPSNERLNTCANLLRELLVFRRFSLPKFLKKFIKINCFLNRIGQKN